MIATLQMRKPKLRKSCSLQGLGGQSCRTALVTLAMPPWEARSRVGRYQGHRRAARLGLSVSLLPALGCSQCRASPGICAPKSATWLQGLPLGPHEAQARRSLCAMLGAGSRGRCRTGQGALGRRGGGWDRGAGAATGPSWWRAPWMGLRAPCCLVRGSGGAVSVQSPPLRWTPSSVPSGTPSWAPPQAPAPAPPPADAPSARGSSPQASFSCPAPWAWSQTLKGGGWALPLASQQNEKPTTELAFNPPGAPVTLK